ncbi:MAG: spermine/spermidine synthase domain-containing protein [Planctomycetota bacterium]|jgi:spermidine synthase
MTIIAIAIFFISAAALGLELVLVRVLSIGHWHHFSYLVISTALLGFGAGGTLVAVGSKSLTRHYRRWLWWFAVGMGAAVPVVFYLSQAIPFDELQLIWDRRQVVYLLEYYLLFFVPFFFAGASLALAFTVFAGRAHRLYFFNMTGSGLGAAGIVALMYGNRPEQLLLVIGGAAFAAAVTLAYSISWRRAAGTLSVAAVYLFMFSPFGPGRLEIDISQHKSLVWYRELPEAEVAAVGYSPLGRVDFVRAKSIHIPPAGMSIGYQGSLPEQAVIISDGDGVSVVNRFAQLSDLNCYRYATSALGYHLVSEPEVCIIGAGGGSDVGQALVSGARKVTAVEMNSQIVDLMRNRLNEFASGLYRRKDVEVVTAEGRSFLQTARRQLDIISISLLDSFSASAAGTGAFNESHLYTVEAIGQALSRLRPGGVLSITRTLKAPARDNLKMFATVAEALRRHGVTEPGRHIMMIRSLDAATIVASPEPFSDTQVVNARTFAQENSFDLVHVPGIKREEVNQYHVLQEGAVYYEAAEQILSPGSERFYRDYAYNIRPATDDKPYFFDFFKWKSLPYMVKTLGRQWLPFSEWGYLVLAATLVQAVLASGLFILLPLCVAKPIKEVRSGKLAALVYFLLLGLAYMFLEMGFIQKMTLLVGHPVFGVAVTLTGFLLFSGLGALASQRVSGSALRTIRIAVTAVVIIGAAEIILMKVSFEWLVAFSRFGRILLGLALTAPPAFFMGMPFPTALRQLHGRRGALVPWAWGVNGFASVTGAVLGTLLAISVGFTTLAVIALGCYWLAAGISRRMCV